MAGFQIEHGRPNVLVYIIPFKSPGEKKQHKRFYQSIILGRHREPKRRGKQQYLGSRRLSGKRLGRPQQINYVSPRASSESGWVRNSKWLGICIYRVLVKSRLCGDEKRRVLDKMDPSTFHSIVCRVSSCLPSFSSGHIIRFPFLTPLLLCLPL